MGYKDISKIERPFTGSVDGFRFSLILENDQRDQKLGDIKRGIVHWTVGPYNMVFDAYHYCFIYDKVNDKTHIVKTLPLDTMGRHAYKGNTGSVGFSFCAMRSAVPSDFGPNPITPSMLDEGARFVAEFFAWHQLDPRDPKQLMDHAQQDAIIGRNEKWDIVPYWADFKTAVLKHYDALKSGKAQFLYKGILK